MFDLCVDGVQGFYARRPTGKRLVRREPLVGLVDGNNKTFLTSHPSWLSDTLKVYVGGAQLDGTEIESLDADGGVVVLKDPPNSAPVSDYTAVPLPNRQITYFAWAGFELVEALFQRGFLLTSNASQYVPATYDDTHIYITGPLAEGNVPTDPVSLSIPERHMFNRATELAFLDALCHDAAASDIDLSERMGGAAFRASVRPRNLLADRQVAYQTFMQALYAAMDAYYPDGRHYGQRVSAVHTDEYTQIWQWQTDAATAQAFRLYAAKSLIWGGLP